MFKKESQGGNKMNFKPELEVPSLELCKKLKELGYPQEGGGWYWDETVNYRWELYLYGDTPVHIKSQSVIKAPTCREILEWIDVAYQKYITSCYLTEKLTYAPEKIEPNRLAEDLIWLVKNGYIKFKNKQDERT